LLKDDDLVSLNIKDSSMMYVMYDSKNGIKIETLPIIKKNSLKESYGELYIPFCQTNNSDITLRDLKDSFKTYKRIRK